MGDKSWESSASTVLGMALDGGEELGPGEGDKTGLDSSKDDTLPRGSVDITDGGLSGRVVDGSTDDGFPALRGDGTDCAGLPGEVNDAIKVE